MQQVFTEITDARLRLVQGYIWNVLLRCRQVRRSLRRRMVPPRSRRIERRSQRRTQPRRHSLTRDLCVPVLIEHLVHAHHHQQRIDRLPRLRLVAQQSKLRGQVLPVLLIALIYKRIHALRIVFVIAPVAFAQRGRQPLRVGPNPQHPLHAVMLYQFRSKKLRYFAGCHAPRHVHLPQAVLRCHIPLRLEKIVEVRCFNVGDSVMIAPDKNRSRQPRQTQLSVKLRKRLAHRLLQPPRAAYDGRSKCDHQHDDNTQKHAQDRPPAPLLDFDTPSQSHLEDIVSSHVVLTWKANKLRCHPERSLARCAKRSRRTCF